MLLSWVMCITGVQLHPLNVYAASGYTEVTSLEEVNAGGEFVLVAVSGENFCVLNTAIDKKINPTGFNAGADMPTWKVIANDGGISLLASENNYLAYKDSTNFTSSESAYVWKVSAGENGFRFTASGDEGRAIAFQAGNHNKFGAYSTSNVGNSNYTFDLKDTVLSEITFKQEYDTKYGDYEDTFVTKAMGNFSKEVKLYKAP